MSGLDEQPSFDIPKCPKCEEKPDLWVLYPALPRDTSQGFIWLFSDEYMKAVGYIDKVHRLRIRDGVVVLKISNMLSVRCKPVGRDITHAFEFDDDVFNKVIKCAEQYDKEGF